MKLLPIIVMMALVVLSCTEEVLVEGPLRIDTVKVQQFVDRYFAGTDTVTLTEVVEVQVPVPARSETDTVIVYETKLDTIYLTRVDTLWITKTIIEHTTDTVVVREYTYGDVLVTGEELPTVCNRNFSQ
jgi:hypothetical protein